ncbi:hypothetical protein EDD17DRAFT_614292 [Pisolithus thermaeus]|nr:hypothetical protein EV401DRAFT_989147 [Pisolithus croceorrhizus]KAI6168314.1 hypothetical protein EDD17DRAFT_614292 [Pisolithus thermaeus]
MSIVQRSLTFRPFGCPVLFTKSTSCRFYSEGVLPKRRNWRVEGHVPPRALVQEGTTALDLTEDEPPVRRRARSDTSETPQEWRSHRERMKEMFPDGWNPTRKLSREAMEALRSLHALDKEMFTTPVLANRFKISPEAVRRILRSKWEPSKEKRAKLAERERRDREERILRSRIEEKRKENQILVEARNNENVEGRGTQKRKGSLSAKDELFFQ